MFKRLTQKNKIKPFQNSLKLIIGIDFKISILHTEFDAIFQFLIWHVHLPWIFAKYV